MTFDDGYRWRGPGPWDRHEWHSRRRFFASPFLPLLVALIQIVGTNAAASHQPEATSLDPLGYGLLVAGPLLLLFRRRRSAHVLVGVFAVTLTFVLIGYPAGPVFISLVVAMVAAFVRGNRTLVWSVAALGYVAFLWGPSIVGTGFAPTWGEVFGVAAWVAAVLAFGEMARTGRQRAVEAARSRREEAQRRAGEERLRIAHELHDVLAHNISLINVQAGVALHLMDDDPEQARSALSAIKDASNETLTELRSVLDILRAGDDAPRTPTPGLDDLDQVIERTRVAGLDVTKDVTGEARPLSPNVDRAAFRIIQEAITNVTRHSSGTRAAVLLDYGAEELVIEVNDDGDPKGIVEAGNGISGMRERAESLGGELEAGPIEGGGFRVRARLPLQSHS